MVHSLRFRLLLTLIVVVMVAVGTVALLASRVSASELQRYVELDIQRRNVLFEKMLTYYDQGARPEDVQALARELSQKLGERVIIIDGAGWALADSAQELGGLVVACDADLAAVVVTLGQPNCVSMTVHAPFEFAAEASAPAPVGDMFVIGAPFSSTVGMPAAGAVQWTGNLATPRIAARWSQDTEFDPIKAGFTSAVNRSLLLAVVAAGLAAIMLTLAFSRRILRPIEDLTVAARAMEKGDLTRRVQVRSKNEIGTLAHAFNAMADGLTRLEHLRRNMVNDVAHELRTPLTNIRGYLEAVRDGVVEPSPALIVSLHEEAMLLNHLIDDLQELALAEAGQLRLERQPVSPGVIVEKAVNAVRPALSDKQLAVSLDMAGSLPDVDADAERVGQVLRNLLNNAIIHTPPGGALAVAARATGAEVEVRVSDTGVGIAAEHLPYIFERFFRADRSRARATGGAGLGLAIVKHLVELHGGRVWAESAPGAGSAFAFTLPMSRGLGSGTRDQE
jgi:signal transduction histidine kinase